MPKCPKLEETTRWRIFAPVAINPSKAQAPLALHDGIRICHMSALGPELIFYDGDCGLCHLAVRFVLARDGTPPAFHFAPIGGQTFEKSIPENERAKLPDSIVIYTKEGTILYRWQAIRHILKRLGRGWKLLSAFMGLIPRSLGDFLYDMIAKVRHRLFARPQSDCPLIPEKLRGRFLP